jgi:glycosyltransferase involved in cell wall biosynthesis
MTGLRVLQLTDSLNPGGLERVVVDLATLLTGRGEEVGVAAEAGGGFWSELPPEVRRFHAPPKGGLLATIRYLRWLRRLLTQGRWHVVHAHQRKVALLARLAVAGTGVRVVEHVHNLFDEPVGFRRLSSFRGHELIACGSAVRDMLVNDFRRPAHRVTLVTNAVSDLGAGLDLTLPSTAGSVPKIIGIGRTVPQKDPGRFVDAMRIVNSDGVRVHAEWVGDGEMFESLRERLAREPVPGLELSGATRHVAEKIRSADLLLITSRWEGLPLAALECAALGRGIVAPDVGSIRDVVRPGRNGHLYPVDATPAEIADVLARSLDPALLADWGRGSRSVHDEGANQEAMLLRVLRVYQRALSRGGTGRRGSRTTRSGGAGRDRARMRMAVVAPHFPEYSIRYAAAMSEHCDVQVYVDDEQVAAEYAGRGPADTGRASLRRVTYKTPGDLLKLVVMLVGQRPSVLHLQEAVGLRRAFFVMCAATLLKPFALVVLTVHDPEAHAGADVARARRVAPAQHLVRRLADVVVVHGEYCAGRYRRHAWAGRQRIVVSDHGVILEPPAAAAPRPEGPLKLYMFGRMEAYKGLEVLLEAAEKLRADDVRFELTVAGAGPEMDRLETRFRRLEGVRVVNGYVPPPVVIESIQEADCVVLPYLEATQSGVMAAAFAGGRFVVASETGGLVDVVEHLRNGLLVAPGDPEALAAAIRRLASNSVLRESLRRGAVETARDRLDWRRIAGQVYEEIERGLTPTVTGRRRARW